MGILSDWQDQWDADHCEVYGSNRITDLADLPVFKPFYRCNDCKRECYEDKIEVTDDDHLCCPSCGSTDIEFVETEE
jgi:rRNA maturation endonuclease Nob1